MPPAPAPFPGDGSRPPSPAGVRACGRRTPPPRPPPPASDALGYDELGSAPDGAAAIVYVGLVPAAHGRCLGGALRTHAVRAAFAGGARDGVLNTCTLDGPAALPIYLARGFRPGRTERYAVPREP